MNIEDGREIKGLLVARGMTQTQLAALSGVSLTYLNGILCGKYVDEKREAAIVAAVQKLKEDN